MLSCEREIGNRHDPQAVAVKKSEEIVGHVSRTISCICFSFLGHGGSIICTITGPRRYAARLVQGGVEVPCTLKFVSPPDQTEFGKRIERRIRYSLTVKVPVKSSLDKVVSNKTSHATIKANNVVDGSVADSSGPSTSSASTSNISASNDADEGVIDTDISIKPSTSSSNDGSCSAGKSDGSVAGESGSLLNMITIQSDSNDEALETAAVQPALKKPRLTDQEMEEIIMGGRLSDAHINRAQKILKRQFFYINGLESSLQQGKKVALTKEMVQNKLQIVYCTDREHWVVATTIKNRSGEVLIFDSVFNSVDDDTMKTVCNLFKHSGLTGKLNVKMIKTPKQKGSDDCGVFSIAYATAIALGRSPAKLTFRQDSMRAHLVQCFYNDKFTMFPLEQ